MKRPLTIKPAWRHPWFWFLMAPLVVSVIVGMMLLAVAVSGGDDRVYDDYYEQGRMINKRFEKERYALAEGISGHVMFDFAQNELRVEFDRVVDAHGLQVLVSHPAKADEDDLLVLERRGTKSYQTDLPEPELPGAESENQRYVGRYYLVITGLDNQQVATWRIASEIDFSTVSTVRFGTSNANVAQ